MTTQKSHEAEHVHAESSPFTDTIEVERFFSGGNRRAILDELLQAIDDAVPIVTLTGDEGSGKTMMCMMVERALPSDYVTVFFPQMVDSFEDVVRLIARRLEVDPAIAAGDIPALLQEIATLLRDRALRLLVIFDEAERIYLATLERVRKMLDLVNSSGPLMQIVLSGRSGLHNNFKNLALCNFIEVEERHIALQPLDLQETGAYLNHALQFVDINGKNQIISPEIVEKVFAESGGNFKQVNVQAEKALRALGPDTSFLVLLDNVQEVAKKNRPRRRAKALDSQKLSFNRRKLALAAGVACLALVVFFFLYQVKGPDRAVVESSSVAKNKIVISQPESIGHIPAESPITPPAAQDVNSSREPLAPSPETTQSEKSEEIEAPEAESPVQKASPTIERPVEQAESAPSVETKQEQPAISSEEVKPIESDKEKNVELAETEQPLEPKAEEVLREDAPTAALAEMAESPIAQQEAVAAGVTQAPVIEEKEVLAPPVSVVEPVELQKNEEAPVEPPARTVETVTDEKVVPAPIQTIKAREIVKYRERMAADIEVDPVASEDAPRIEPERNKVAVIKLAQPAKIKPEVTQEPQVETQAPPVVRQAEPQKVVIDAPVVTKSPAAPRKSEGSDKVYSRRIAAGTPWLLGLKDDRYTVQLMVVTDSDGEEKLKKMLTQKSLQGQADKVYILRKESAPDVKYVFYGEYPTMTDARNARNTLPEALRGTKPYAVSVKGAVQKIQQED